MWPGMRSRLRKVESGNNSLKKSVRLNTPLIRAWPLSFAGSVAEAEKAVHGKVEMMRNRQGDFGGEPADGT